MKKLILSLLVITGLLFTSEVFSDGYNWRLATPYVRTNFFVDIYVANNAIVNKVCFDMYRQSREHIGAAYLRHGFVGCTKMTQEGPIPTFVIVTIDDSRVLAHELKHDMGYEH